MKPTLICATLELLKARLGERLREINEEIRAYPQPIARCDAQLGGLVDERARIHAELAEIDARLGERAG
jgi:hypothetical protein